MPAPVTTWPEGQWEDYADGSLVAETVHHGVRVTLDVYPARPMHEGFASTHEAHVRAALDSEPSATLNLTTTAYDRDGAISLAEALWPALAEQVNRVSKRRPTGVQ